MRQRRLLVTLDNRHILIHGGNPLGLPPFLIAPGDIPNPARLHILKGSNRITLWKDEALLHLALRTQAFQLLVVKLFRKLSDRRDFRGLYPSPRSRYSSCASNRMSSGQSPPMACNMDICSINWLSSKPRLRFLTLTLASISPGYPSDRKARDMASAPAWGLLASVRGLGSNTNGVFLNIGSLADMILAICQSNNKMYFRFNKTSIFRNYAMIRDLPRPLTWGANIIIFRHVTN
jgi:hypothetical protein